MLSRIGDHAERTLISDSSGTYSGTQLLAGAGVVAHACGPLASDIGSERIALLAEPGIAYVSGLLGIWARGAMAVPLCPEHPPAEMLHVLDDADVSLVVVDPRLAHLLPKTSVPTVSAPTGPADLVDGTRFGDASVVIAPDLPALMLYTSGTTGRPKGVVHTHATVVAQISCLVEAWEWVPDDRITHFLPLHHVHGLVNQLLCPLWVGARCDMFPRFDATTVFEALAAEPYTIFMAVPTIYSKAIAAWEAADHATQGRWSSACSRLRVTISGSAALAVPVLERWREISGHTLLERYGMTEIGIALTNPLHGDRRPGFVGGPLPRMEVRVVDDGKVLTGNGITGELQVRGANVFTEYWRRPDETAASFTADGWFLTGDQVTVDHGAFRITGRLSTDIIKSGGYKISALEIEGVLLAHPAIAECSVVGVPDDTWGERVGAALVLRPGHRLELEALRTWARSELAPYKLPTLLLEVETLPRNVMGKVLKPAVRSLFAPNP
jgi:malonyl-CoA/methylmalonyl-CoA synthetase